MEVLLHTAIAIALVSAISFIGVFTLSLSTATLGRVLFALVSLAAGALFGNALFHLIPESLHAASSETFAAGFVALGIVAFYILEKFLHWRHQHRLAEGAVCEDENCHPSEGEHAPHPVGQLVLFADGLHNATDGIIIAGAFLISPAAGIATTIAVILHEIPQEIGDFSLLLHSGFSRTRALLFNFFSSLAAFLGAGAVFIASTYTEFFIPYIVAFAAGGFLYIAGADLMPELHKTTDTRRSIIQFFTLLIGLVFMFGLATLSPDPHDEMYDHATHMYDTQSPYRV